MDIIADALLEWVIVPLLVVLCCVVLAGGVASVRAVGKPGSYQDNLATGYYAVMEWLYAHVLRHL